MKTFVKILTRIWSKSGMIVIVIVVLAIGYWLGGTFSSPKSSMENGDDHQHGVETKEQIWTCSMHPQIRLPKPGLCPICNMALIPGSVGDADGMAGARQLTVSANAKKLMDIVTAPVERKFVTAEVRMVGKIDYDETRLAYITAWIPGRLDRLFVDYTGVPVQKGDHLVYLYSPELITAQEELLQSLEAVKNIQETRLDIMRETTEATVTATREKLRLWGLNAEQIANIERSGEVTDHMTIYAPAGGIVIHKDALEGMYVKEGTRIYTIADLSQVWVKLDAYESDLEWLRYGQDVEFTTVSYPGVVFTGTIAFVDPVLNEKTRSVKIRVNAPNADGRLKPEMFVKAVVRAQVAGGGRIMDADLVGKWMCPMHPDIVKDSSGRCDICEMPLATTESQGYASDDPALAQKPLVIPVTAALVTGTRAIVYVELPDAEKPTFEGRQIVLGPRAGDYYLVRSGLQEGERVVVKGNFKIDSALQIMAKPSMMTPEGGGGGGGHDHGSAKSAQGQSGPAEGDLAPLSRHQIQVVMMAADNVNKAIMERNLAQIRSAFADLGKTIKDVDMALLSGHTHMLWMDLSMRLTNDAVEGSQAKSMEAAARVAEILAENMKSLKSRLGITSDDRQASRPAVSEAFVEQLAEVFEGYFAIQQALADDKPETVPAASGRLSTALKAVDMKLVTGTDHDLWMKNSNDIRAILQSIEKTSDIKSQREYFYQLSQHIIRLAKHFGAPVSEPFYVLHCPMAFDNRGAEWLQRNDQTRNPYFGQMMLQCGGVTEVVPVTIIEDKKDN